MASAAGGKKVMLVALLVALLVVSAQASVTVVNLDSNILKVLVNGATVNVSTGTTKVDVKGGKSQDILVKGPNGKDIKVKINDGDVLVVIPDLTGGNSGGIIVNVNGVKAP